MLDLEVIPERALVGDQWEFVLGMPLAQAIEILKKQCLTVKRVHLNYNNQIPLDVDIVLDLTNDGVKLIFDPKAQRLKIIEIYDVKKVKLKYCNKVFNSPQVSPTVEKIHDSFGPTLPGQVDTKEQLYLLLFRGILFAFPVWSGSELVPGLSTQSPDLSELSTQRSFILSRVCIFSGNDSKEARAPRLPLECFHGNCYCDSVALLRVGGAVTGLSLKLIADDSHHSKLGDSRPRVLERTVQFGDTPQDIASALGAPSQHFYKAEDKMRIHSPSPHKLPMASSSDYFFNYFTLGLDVLFDAVSNRAKKFVMHSNVPGHYNFNMYYRCDYVLTFPIGEDISGDSQPSQLTVTPSTKWSEVQDYLTTPTDKPVVLNRSSSTNSVNPFGSTYCYGFQNFIFEVMRNQHIPSVTVYSPPP
ncbi:phagosome assembly factor 1-like [Halichondria panicea]|uniref:phagosome assembly factor 1-like n=1 Tax=Halichondria panicea TaxID=6063 RepID=UPI00312BB50B